MKSIEFTCTHVVQRGFLMARTAHSLFNKLKGVDFSKSTIYVNADSIVHRPDLRDYSNDVIKLLNKNFGQVIWNPTNSPNFSKAIHWCWSQPKEDFFFHIEDDWILKKEININELIQKFDDSDVYAVNLRAYSFNQPKPCLLQSVWRKSFCEKFINSLDFDRNPENQLRSFVKETKYYNIHYPEGIDDIVVEDIGREWLRKNSIERNHISSKFISYKER